MEKITKNMIDVPGDGNCLFWALSLAYLEPVKNDKKLFTNRYQKLFGEDNKENINNINIIIIKYIERKDKNLLLNSILKDKIFTFRQNLVNFIETKIKTHQDIMLSELSSFANDDNTTTTIKTLQQHLQEMKNDNKYGTNLEIKFASEYLNALIEVHIVESNQFQSHEICLTNKEDKSQHDSQIKIASTNGNHFQMISMPATENKNTIANITNTNDEITSQTQFNINKQNNFLSKARIELENELLLNKSLSEKEITQTTNIYINSLKTINPKNKKNVLTEILENIHEQIQTFNKFEEIKAMSNKFDTFPNNCKNESHNNNINENSRRTVKI